MNDVDKNNILWEIAPYISDVEFLKKLIEESKNKDDLKNKLKNIIKEENDIIKKTDIKIILDKL